MPMLPPPWHRPLGHRRPRKPKQANVSFQFLAWGSFRKKEFLGLGHKTGSLELRVPSCTPAIHSTPPPRADAGQGPTWNWARRGSSSEPVLSTCFPAVGRFHSNPADPHQPLPRAGAQPLKAAGAGGQNAELLLACSCQARSTLGCHHPEDPNFHANPSCVPQ